MVCGNRPAKMQGVLEKLSRLYAIRMALQLPKMVRQNRLIGIMSFSLEHLPLCLLKTMVMLHGLFH